MLNCLSIFSVPVPIPSITVSGTATAGTELNLTCNYTESTEDITVNISVTVTGVIWMLDGTAVVPSPDINSDAVVNGTDETSGSGDIPGRISIAGATLSFSPVATSDSGRYTCQLTVTTSQTHVTVQGPVESAAEDITVQSNIWRYYWSVYNSYLPPHPSSPST